MNRILIPILFFFNHYLKGMNFNAMPLTIEHFCALIGQSLA